MKSILFFLLLLWVFVPHAWAQVPGGTAQDLEKDLREELYGQKDFLNNNSQNNASSAPNPADKENQLIAQQLEIITGDEETRYTIVPGDTLTISFHDRDSINTGIYQVSSEGNIFLPLAGKTKIAGLNRKEAQEMIDDVLGLFIRKVDAHIKINMDGRVMVLGAVARPGIVEFNEQPITVMDALLAVGIGGYDPHSAKLNSILVMRGEMNKPIVIRLDLKKMIKTGDRSDNILLKPGDLIYVPTTFMSELDSFGSNLYQKYLIWSDLGGQDLIKPGRPPF